MTPPTISPSRSIPSVVYGGQTAKPRRSDTKRATASPSINRIGHFIGQFGADDRSEEHTSELQSLMRNSYAVFCLKKKKLIKSSHQKTYNISTICLYEVHNAKI